MPARGETSSATLSTKPEWRKSRHSNPDGNCVELAVLSTGEIGLRNSRHASGPIVVCTHAEIMAFIRGAKDGEFDDFLE